jgi:hypothetical protein
MTRLILEEGGKRRAFKVGDGVISIGSGAHAALKLASAGVAELHAELVIHGGRVTLKPKPGVMPPKMGPRSLTAETELKPGASVKIGDATLTVEAPEGAATPAERAVAAAAKAPQKEDWQRSNRELYKSGGLKPAHMLMLLVPLGLVGFFVFKKMAEQSAPDVFAGQTYLYRAQDFFKSGMPDSAQKELERIPADAIIPPEIKAQIDALRVQIAESQRVSQLTAENDAGSKYFETQLKSYEQTRLQGKIDKPAVRVFLKRIAEFEARWPRHPQLEWTKRMKDSYGVLVDMKAPATYADIEFEVKSLTWANPRDYKQALAVLQRFADGAQPDERAKALALIDTTLAERKAWYEDRTQQAKFEYDRNQVAKAVNWLLVLATNTGDEEMENAAAARLLQFPDIEEHFRGYRTARPDWWPEIAANKTIAAWLRENPLDK